MIDLSQQLATELSLKPRQIQSALELLAEGATIPFIARYRKERTGEMTEIQLRQLSDRFAYLTELQERKQTILATIREQGRLTPELHHQIEGCTQKTELEDLYLPYRPKRRTRATTAREQGLGPLAERIGSLNRPQIQIQSLQPEAQSFMDEDKGIKTVEEALQGAADILAEGVAERAEIRSRVRDWISREGMFLSRIPSEHPEGSTQYEMYRQFQAPYSQIAPHNLLALLRGESEKILTVELSFDEAAVLSRLERDLIQSRSPVIRQFYQKMIKDAFTRLIKPSLLKSLITDKKAWADQESIQTFATNLRDLLLAAPAGMKPTLAIDPGFRTGCKLALIDQTGKFLEHQTIYPHTGANKRQQAISILRELIHNYRIQLIAIGNGTAGRETDGFVAEAIQDLDPKPIKVMVNESGASVYSASTVAIEEFPHLDITVRGAISIGRRLQDPLAELVKIEPKSIGVGQYQHDVDQKRLKQKLEETVESCVNFVGVDLNTASKHLLTFVSGITPTIANNIIHYRDQQGAFQDRKQLLKVSKLGAKAFQQAAGFLRIRDGDHPLDNTAVHPESYDLVQRILSDHQLPLTDLPRAAEQLQRLDLKQYISDAIGEPTLRDILEELKKPGRDPRAQFTYAQFREDIREISDLRTGMILEGIVTNVANFGAFVDIGVHQDGLVHISQMANYFVKDPKQVVKVGQVVRVKVLEVNEPLKRIGLSIKAAS